MEKSVQKGTKALDKYQGRLSKLVDKLKTISKRVIQGSFVAAIGGLKIGSDFEKYKAMMMTAVKGSKEMRKLGDTKTVAGDYFSWANEFANTTPFTNDELIKGTVRLASFGYDPKKLMTILGDMSAARGTSLMQGIEAFIDSGTGEMERFKEYGITKDKIKSYARGIGVDPNSFLNKSNQITNNKLFLDMLLRLIQSETKGGMKDRENTLGGRFSTTVGLLKFNIGKMVGIMKDGEIRQGSLIDKVKERFSRLNQYLNSEEGKAKIDKWVASFDKGLNAITSILSLFWEKFKQTLEKVKKGNFIEKIQDAMNNFDPSSFNKSLDSVINKFDNIYTKVQRATAATIGYQLGMAFGFKGALAGAALGFFSPEIAKGIEMLNEKFKEDEEKKNKALKDYEARQKELGITPENSRPQTTHYAPGMQLAEERKNNVNITMNNPTFNNGQDVDKFAKAVVDNLNNM